MKPSRDILNRVLMPYKHDEFPRDEPLCPACDRRYISVSIRDGKKMLKRETTENREIDLTCLSRLDPTWQGV